ncbi:cytochrome d ubiquinol oxidase subunit II [Asanoa sp. WMMD1127]|uniref:cytochrome d ubiquinol oxidase subunit II n=1 Tax=Asanoa sp. WMMD1127 TaxID=3016107 RepID=UPI00241636C3|nr:cytochrome d ubiquinol oxidase subunit II [Asanoa sp. WMMD1127]MDG4820749.1 cytochrome d ubiquinol oxidase subunit II [Asanoa sp. WMMD1127]
MDVLWLLVLGLFLVGWFVLDGFDLGLGATLPLVGRDGYERRAVISAMGPFFLANEVWLVVTAGLLVGAFPRFESDLLRAFYPLVIALLVAWLARDAAIWFRSRLTRPGWRRTWDAVLTGASVLFAVAWGVLFGNLLQGLPAGGPWPSLLSLVDPFALIAGVTVALVLAAHGATFTAMRLTGPPAERAVAVARRLALPAAAALVLAAVAGAIQPAVRAAVTGAVPALLLVLVGAGALVAGWWLVGRGRHRPAFLATCLAAAAPPLAVGFAVADRILVGVADAASLERLNGLALPILPVLLLAQVWLWWQFRRRVTAESVVFF